jgi:TRAP-type mannitol/chloroaromatic compound transport system substrate-binding protein
LKWACKRILNDGFFDSLAMLEDAMQKEKLFSTNVHKVLEEVMKIQEIPEDQVFAVEKIFQDIVTDKMIAKEFHKIQESITKKREEIEMLCKENNVMFDEVKEISNVLN